MTVSDTRFVHVGRTVANWGDAVVEPIVLATTFLRAADGSYPSGYEYARDGNPNRAYLERAMANLEGGVEAAAFASGMAAALAIFQTLRPGDHVVVSDDCYFGVREALQHDFTRWGLDISFVDATNLDAVAICTRRNTRVLFVETPSNPFLRVCDIAALANIAHSCHAVLVCDNSLATPVFQNPLLLGADFVVHSTTKYINGHHDAQGGIVVSRESSERWESIVRLQKTLGAVPSPFNCWLSSRGLPSLPCRVRQQSASASVIASHLDKHRLVDRVLYPGLASNASHQVAIGQMSGFGSVFSFLVSGGGTEAKIVTAASRLLLQATSFGGAESLIEHRASVEGAGTNVPQNLIRVAIGLEDVNDVIEDLDRALHAIQ